MKHGEGPLTKTAVIARLCALASEVGEHRFQEAQPHDCFCDMSRLGDEDFRFSEEVLAWIELVVRSGLGLAAPKEGTP